jgi:predicted MFS family arabinose efflux permease
VRGAFWALGLTAGSWGSRIPDVKDDLGLSEGALGSALLGLSIGAVIGAWFGGLLVHRLGGRRVIAGSWAAVGLLLLTPGLAGSWAALAGAALVVGLAIGVLDVAMNGAGVQLEQQAAEPLLNGLHARWSAGVLVGAGAGAVLVAVGVDVAVHLGAVGLLLVVGAVANRHRLPDGRLAAPGLADAPEPFDDLGDLVGDRAADRPATSGAGRSGLAALAAIGGFVFLGEGALMDWAGVLVRDDLDGGAVLGALAVTGLSAGGLAGRLAGDRLAVRWGPAPLVRRGATLAAVALAAVLLSPVAALVPVLLVGVGAGLAPAVPLAFAAAGRQWGEHGIAVVTTAGYGCYLAAPALVGGLAHATNLHAALLVPLVLVVGVIPLAWSTDP